MMEEAVMITYSCDLHVDGGDECEKSKVVWMISGGPSEVELRSLKLC